MTKTQRTRQAPRRPYALLPAAALLTLLALPGAVSAQQWTTSSNSSSNISTASGVNNVGVGTASPTYELHVEGASTAANNFSQGYFKNTSTASPYGGVAVDGQSQSHVRFMLGGVLKWQWRVGAGAGTDDLRAFNWALGRDVLTMTNGGNVGIGTTSPANALHVNNDLGPGMMRVSGAGLGLINLGDTTAPTDKKLYQLRSEGGLFRLSLINDGQSSLVQQNILVANSSGNVGIGTSAPDAKLVVSGAVPSQNGFMSVIRTTGSNNGYGLVLDAAGTGNNNFGFSVAGVSKGGFSWDNSRNFIGFFNMAYSAGDFALRLNSDGSLTYNDGLTYPGPERFRVTAAGNVGVGTASPAHKLDVSGSVAVGSAYTSSTTVPANGLIVQGGVGIGTSSPGASYKLDVSGDARVSGALSVTGAITGATVNAVYQDVAEWVPSAQKLQAGTVVVLDPERSNHVLASTSAYDTKVAGVVSAEPGVILGVGGEGKLKVATTGRVKVRADATRAPIHVGDLLVTSDVEGVAMKSVPVDLGGTQIHRPGTIVGKALEPLEKGTGEILVLLSLQ